MLRPNRGIIQPRRNRVRVGDLPRGILQHVRVSALQNSRRSSAKPRRMFTQAFAAAARLDSNQANFLIFYELVEDSDRVRPSTNARDDRGRQFPLSLQDLRPSLAPDHAMKVPHHRWIRMRTQYTSQ